jgi:hypothetical protein
MAFKPLRSLRQMADDTSYVEGKAGIRCPECGCCDMRVETTRRGDGLIVRYRVCRHCGSRRATVES